MRKLRLQVHLMPKMKKLLNQEFGSWNSKQPYEKILIQHVDFPAQQVHVLSEQREFGSYQSVLALPVGKNHPDASALILMNYILGESQISSRLAQELREKMHWYMVLVLVCN